jgi:hypothetical protein
MPYDTVVVTDFADLECEASAKSVAVCATREQQLLLMSLDFPVPILLQVDAFSFVR